MKPQKRPVDRRNFLGAKNRVIPQPLGVVGVIVPWNFPLNLSILPLIYIFAAGNRAMVKMSENSRHLARLMIEKMPGYFPRDKLAVFDETGGVGVDFSRLPFDHLLFTGSSQTGRSVMAAAAQNLCPVTLELGGKSPAIVCDDYPLAKAAERILFVKLFNAGQICTTVDYLFLPEAKVDAFVTLAQADRARALPASRFARLHRRDRRAGVPPHHRGARGGRGPRRHAGAAGAGPTLGRGNAQDRAAPGAECPGRLRAPLARDFRRRCCRCAATARSTR